MPTRRELANAIRALAMDAVQRANSGHPGMPMGMADIAEVLWNDYLRHNPADPAWHNRDRFIISNGHGSMLLYSLLHLTGYDFPMRELENFRQLGSKTAGHPESHLHPAIETTTGPLGQGLANGVGMALAEKILAARFNRPGHSIVDHHTYVLAGDGCLMEGVSHEACSLAGTLGLGKLIVFYDDNGISIDGEVEGWFTDDTPDRFRAYGWHVIEEVDGHDADAVKRAIEVAQGSRDKPTLICCQTVIGFGAPNKEGTAATHGAALGDEEVAAAREELGWEHPPFHIPEAIYEGWDARHDGAELQATWQERFEAWKAEYPELAAEYERRMQGGLPADWDAVCEKALAEAAADESKAATRKSSQAALEALAPHLPELVGGSADLSGSNNTEWSGSKVIARDDADGNYIHFGVREFAMTAIANGMCLHGGFIPYVGTFLVFSDYARNAVRMAALMEVGSILVYTHDSIGLGEDGPTHQPIEHLASLRLIPNMEVWRPADRFETLVAWRRAVERRTGPVSLVLSRQGLPAQARDAEQKAAVVRGGYTLVDCEGEPELIYLATGSEVHLAVAAAQRLAQDGRRVRVVSMPCHSVFDQQDAAYRESVLPAAVQKRISVEAGVPEFWYHYVGAEGRRFGMTRFGESAPGGDLFEHFGFTAERLVELAEEIL